MTNQIITLPESLHKGYEQHFSGSDFAVFDPFTLAVCNPPKPFVTPEGIHGKVLVEQTVGIRLPFAILALMQGWSCGNGGFDSDRKIVDVKSAKYKYNDDPRNMIYPATAIIGIVGGVAVRQRVVHLNDINYAASPEFHAKLANEQEVVGAELLRTLGLDS